jgi:hypothetical protein
MPGRRQPQQPRDLRHFLRLEIDKEMEVNEHRLKNLSTCLGELLQLSGCTEIQAILALLISLKATIFVLPEGEDDMSVLITELLLSPTRRGKPAA